MVKFFTNIKRLWGKELETLSGLASFSLARKAGEEKLAKR